MQQDVQIETAINEASQGFPFKIQPMTIVSYTVDHDNLVDLRMPDACDAAEIDPADLACAWERIASEGGQPPSWTIADRLIGEGIGGIIVPSFAPGRGSSHANIVFWRWGDNPPEQVVVHDPEGRLPRNQSSWGV